MKTYMIIENYRPGKAQEIYSRFNERGRLLPPGVEYIDSWVEENLQKCYQVVKSNSVDTIFLWLESWKDLMDFEVIPVMSTSEARNAVHSKKES